MAMLTVVKFPSAEGTRSVLTTLEDLQRQQLITIHDAVIAPPDRRKPRTEMELSATNLSKEEEDTLRTAFEHE